MRKSIFAVAIAAVLTVASFTANAGIDKWTDDWAQGTTEYMYTNKQNMTVNFSCSPDRPMSIHLDNGNRSTGNQTEARATIIFNNDKRTLVEVDYNDNSMAGLRAHEYVMQSLASEKSVTVIIGKMSGTFPLTGSAKIFKDNDCASGDEWVKG
ncbi:hypothetical protein SPLA10_PHROGS00119 [Salmonella phage SPLA10]|nr:hypothetical protein SPLA10_PHROGS00119 [Salmonella phage SPLA10]